MTSGLLHSKYRRDIDGLRAIAVLSVVLYHAFPGLLPGGFVGVDVFFVISGFLISTILFQNIDSGTFNIGDFYSRRVRRIFPALVIILFTVLIMGWFCLFPEEYQQLGKHTSSSAGFIQNFSLWKEAGYFDNASETKPLLHIWSLGIEEQFYFVWPLLLWWCSSFFKKESQKKLSHLLVTALVFFTSFLLNINLINIDKTKTFYLPQYRFWELASGGILSWIILYKNTVEIKFKKCLEKIFSNEFFNKIGKNIMSFVGFLSLIIIFFQFNKETIFPGKMALLPVLTAVFVIYAGPESFLNRNILSNKILVWFGLISFPLYLWHWPLLSLARIIKGEEPSNVSILIVLVLSIILAWITYHFIEKRIRFSQNRKTAWILCCLLLVMLIFGQYINGNSGIKNRGLVFRNGLETGNDGGDQGNLIDGCGISKEMIEKFPVGGCRHDKRGVSTFALIGDSKSASLVGGLVRYSDKDDRILFIGGNGKYGAVTPYNSTNYSKDRDGDLPNPLSNLAIKAILENKNIKTVIVYYATRSMFKLKNDKDILDLPESKNFNFAYDRTNELVQKFVAGGKKIVFVMDNPTLINPINCRDRKLGVDFIDQWRGKQIENKGCSISYDRHLELSSQYRKLLEKIQEEYPTHVKIFDTVPLLCNIETRICSVTLNGHQLYSYTDHISDYAAGLIAEKLIPFMKTFGSTTKGSTIK